MSEKKSRILVVDDAVDILEVIKMRLELLGYHVDAVSDPLEALEKFEDGERYDLLLTDQKMDGLTGTELMEKCREIDNTLQTIIFTAFGTIEQAVEAVKKGAYSYVSKPIDHNDLSVKIAQAIEKRSLLNRMYHLEKIIGNQFRFVNMIGNSPAMQKVFSKIAQVATTESTIAIYGESGTGKELAARAIHLHSNRADAPFIATNCAAIPETLLEDELFGHIKGSFTGASGAKEGLFRTANRGTLFLDEVGEMSEAMQAKLLRVIETGEIKPIGSDKVIKVDVRLIVATKRNLKELVEKDKFREDLYYRIHVIPVYLPPLRERKEDIIPLFQHFMKKYSGRAGKKIVRVEQAVVERLMNYNWPGNVRELENMVEYLVAMCRDEVITEDLLPETTRDPAAFSQTTLSMPLRPLREVRDEFTKEYLINLFRHTKGNVSQAAQIAGYYRADFYKLFQKYDLDPKTFKTPPGTKKTQKAGQDLEL